MKEYIKPVLDDFSIEVNDIICLSEDLTTIDSGRWDEPIIVC